MPHRVPARIWPIGAILVVGGCFPLARLTDGNGVDASDGGDVRDGGGGADGGPEASPPRDAARKRIFMTRSFFSGDLVGAAHAAGVYDGGDGLVAADALCQREAPDPAAGRWIAWVSIAGTGAISRFVDKGPRVSVTGTPVLPKVGLEPVNRIPDVDGNPDDASTRAWTGSSTDGFPTQFQGGPSDCKGWTSGCCGDIGTSGNPNVLGDWSAAFYGDPCAVGARLYCIEE